MGAGLDVENGLHEYLTDDPELVALAAVHGIELRDLRKPPPGLNVPTGANLELDARIVLTVGSDCAIGKMTVALELDREAKRRGLALRLRADRPDRDRDRRLGDLGGRGRLRLRRGCGRATRRRRSAARGGELLWVEGQGALLHPAYSGVTLGLIHGAAPHAFVLCHLAGHDRDRGLSGPPAADASRARRAARADRPARAGAAKVEAIALNTRDLDEAAARAAVAAAEAETGLPADDPVRFGCREARGRAASPRP